MSRDHRGLGLTRQRTVNEAFLVKLGWRFLINHNALWVQVWRAKYGPTPFETITGRTSTGLIVLRAMRKVWPHVLRGARWAVCDGKTVNFWMDLWLPSSSNLFNASARVVPQEFLDKSVRFFISDGDSWLWHMFSHLIPNAMLLQIASTPPPREELGCDRLYWGPSPTGKSTTKSAYSMLHGSTGLEMGRRPLWRAVWKWPGS
ncbi:Unknown protein [Striga hermonthica]|uniref:Reverse transcriptase zinc-binding domain-containing protein n=1 Tax=Striga hermonthica TaxID=68872 RepID=A0A9N7NMT3_STRHE|nr:Unknown protein [Striga hermonthica]